MGKVKKTLWVGLVGIIGLLLTLAGIDLIQLSQSLILYSGLALISLAILLYFLQ